jgi:hypothetical protein
MTLPIEIYVSFELGGKQFDYSSTLKVALTLNYLIKKDFPLKHLI